MVRHPVLEKAEKLGKAIKNTNFEDEIEFYSLIVKCNQIIEQKSKLDYGSICAVNNNNNKCGGGC